MATNNPYGYNSPYVHINIDVEKALSDETHAVTVEQDDWAFLDVNPRHVDHREEQHDIPEEAALVVGTTSLIACTGVLILSDPTAQQPCAVLAHFFPGTLGGAPSATKPDKNGPPLSGMNLAEFQDFLAKYRTRLRAGNPDALTAWVFHAATEKAAAVDFNANTKAGKDLLVIRELLLGTPAALLGVNVREGARLGLPAGNVQWRRYIEADTQGGNSAAIGGWSDNAEGSIVIEASEQRKQWKVYIHGKFAT